jgi:hypothetical protein
MKLTESRPDLPLRVRGDSRLSDYIQSGARKYVYWGPERFDPNVTDQKALNDGVNALSEKMEATTHYQAIK